jgi:integrase
MDLDARWAYVLDFEGDELTEAWSAKSESSRRGVPLHPLLADTLRRIEPVTRPDGTLSPWVFPVTDARRKVRLRDRRGRVHPVRGDRRSPQTTWLGLCLRQALAAAGIERRVTVHGLRRTFAVLLQDAGAPDSVIRQALGHAQQGVTEQHYLPRRDPVVQGWVDRIEIRQGGRPARLGPLPSGALLAPAPRLLQ